MALLQLFTATTFIVLAHAGFATTDDDDFNNTDYSMQTTYDSMNLTNYTYEFYGNISCGDTAMGNLSMGTKMVFIFYNSEQQDVLFSNCGSDFDTVLYLYNNGSSVFKEQSLNDCGDDCTFGDWCEFHETFVMDELEEG